MKPEILKLSISSPQPRLNEIFHFTLDFTELKTSIFGELAAIEPTKDVINPKNGKKQVRINTQMLEKMALRLNKTALEKGKFEAGPLTFELNGTKYTTNKISYEVVDSLPDVDEGLWFRKGMIAEKIFCIIIEQRTLVKIIRTKTEYGTTNAVNDKRIFPFVAFKTIDFNPIPGLKPQGSNSSNGSFDSGDKRLIDGKEQSYRYSYSISYFEIIDPKANIILTKENFDNIPADYKFEDIVIQ